MTNDPVDVKRVLPLRWLLLTIVAIPAGVAGCGSDAPAQVAATVTTVDPSVTADFDYHIPAGTGARLDAGEEILIFPARIDAKLGQTIRIVNDDDRTHSVGPYVVLAHSTLATRFHTEGVFEGMCSVHPSGEIIVAVTA